LEKKIEEFREGIFSLNTRRFGKVAEMMIQSLYDFDDSDDISYDLRSKNGEKIEVKFSRVFKTCGEEINYKNVINSVLESKTENRMISFDDVEQNTFDCNIQQVKTRDFKYLYYGCFFKDKILIMKIDSEKIRSDSEILYSDHQHSGNKGEGQFHVNNKTIKHHIDCYFKRWLTYEELYNLFK